MQDFVPIGGSAALSGVCAIAQSMQSNPKLIVARPGQRPSGAEISFDDFNRPTSFDFLHPSIMTHPNCRELYENIFNYNRLTGQFSPTTALQLAEIAGYVCEPHNKFNDPIHAIEVFRRAAEQLAIDDINRLRHRMDEFKNFQTWKEREAKKEQKSKREAK